MALPEVGVRLTAQGTSEYIRDLSRAEAANEKFIASITNAGASASRGLPNIATTAQRQSASVVTSFDRAGRSATSFGATVVRGVGVAVGAMAALGAAQGLANFASNAIQTRVTFERELANVGALAQATQAEIELLGGQAEALGASTAFSATDVLGGQQFLALAGFEIPEIVEALPGLLSTAAAAQEDLATTSDIVSNALSGFNIDAAETGRVADVLIQGLTTSNTDLVQLGTALSFAAPNAAALGVSIEETTAAIGLLSNAGIQSSRAGTTLRGVFNRLAAPTAEASAELERLGINAFTAEGQLKALPDVVAEFERGLDGLNDQQRAESINTIVGAVAGTGFTALLSAGSEELRIFTQELENSGGVAERVADQQLDNLAGDITRVSSAYEGLQLAVTRAATPSLRSFLQNAVLPSITGTTAFFNALSDGQTVLDSFAVGIADIAPDTSAFLGELSDLQGVLSGLSFEDVAIDLGDALRLNIADDFGVLNVNDVITGTYDFTSAIGTFNVNDFITGEFDFGIGEQSARIKVGDLLDFSAVSADHFIDININDVITGTYDFTSAVGTFNINDFITGQFDFGIGSTTQKLKIGDIVDFTSVDLGEQLGTATKLQIGDLIDFTSATTGDLFQVNINDVIVGTYDLASAFGTISISDLVTGSLDFSTGEGSVTLGSDIAFEFDLGQLRDDVQSEISSLQDELSGLTIEEAALGSIQLVADGISSASDTISQIDTSGFDNLESISGILDSVNTTLSGATGEGSNLASFVETVNTSLSSLATTIDSVDAESVGASFTGAIESVLGIFTTLNTIDDLALGGIAGSLSDVTTSILGFATDFTTGVDSEALGQAAGDSAKLFVDSFSAVISEPDIPEIAGAAAGLVAALGSSIRTSLESANLNEVGAEIGSLASTLLEQLGSTLSDPQFAEDIGTGFTDILVGITQGLSDALGGFNEEIADAENSVAGSITIFTSNLISAIATGLETADYGALVGSLLSGIANAIVFGGGASESESQQILDQVRQQQEEQASIGENVSQNLSSAFEFLFGTTEDATTELGDQSQAFADSTTAATATIVANTAAINAVASGAQVAVSAPSQTLTNVAPPVQIQQPSPAQPTGGQTLQFVAPPVGVVPDIDTQSVDALSESTTSLTSNASSASSSIAELSAQIGSIPTIEGAGNVIPEARRTGIGDETGFDEASITSSINEQIASQLNFGDLPDTVSSTITGAIESAIPPTPVIDSEAVNTAVLTAAQEAIPASEIPEFPSWNEVVGFQPPRLPRFPGWKEALGFEPPPIPEFPGWGSFIEFDIPSIPSFPPWASLVGGVDIGSLIPPFPGWAALVGSTGSAPSPPSTAFQTGTESAPRTGVALVGEEGPELRLINQGDRIFPANVTSRILNVARSIASGMPTINSDPSVRGGGNTVIAPSTSVANVTISASGGGDASIDTNALGISIAQGFGEAFAIPSFIGWDNVFSATPVEIPPFPGWNALVGELENVNLIIQQTENITEVTIEQEEKSIGVGPIEPIPIGDLTPLVSADPGAFSSSSSAVAPTSEMGNTIEASSTVVNNTTQNFNLTTNSMRSSEQVESDFAMMERLAGI